ncbi:MAG TPA: Uma2 family endonuclease [Pirellulales bacterium]
MSTIARLTLDEYDRLIERAVLLRDRRIELIHGELREKSPIGDPHRDAVNVLTNEWFAAQSTAAFRAAVTVQVQSPIRLPALASSPHPDMSWIAKRAAGGASNEADEVFLVIEVADTSLEDDRGEKAELYAEAEIPEYWIVNIPERCVEVRRNPLSGHYRSVASYRAGDEIQPLLFPDCPLQVSLLFA